MIAGELPRLVVVEGVDGVGKSTLARRIASEFGFIYEYPVPDPFLSIRSGVEALGDIETRFFYYLAANVCLQRGLRERIAAGHRFVFDRYVYSTFATHEAMGARTDAVAISLMPFMVPDLGILLTCESSVRNQRILSRGREGEEYVRRVGPILDRTEKLMAEHCVLRRIDTTGMTEDEVFGVAKELLLRVAEEREVVDAGYLQ